MITKRSPVRDTDLDSYVTHMLRHTGVLGISERINTGNSDLDKGPLVTIGLDICAQPH